MKRLISLLLVLALCCPAAFAQATDIAKESRLLVSAINRLLIQYYTDPFVFENVLEETDERIVFASREEEAICTMCYNGGTLAEIGFTVSGMEGIGSLDMAATMMQMLAADSFGVEAVADFTQWYSFACDQVIDGLAVGNYASALYEMPGSAAVILLEAVVENGYLSFNLTMGEKGKLGAGQVNAAAAAPEKNADNAIEIPEGDQLRGTYSYEMLEDNTIRITDFEIDGNSPGGIWVVPEEIDGYIVSEVDMYALECNSSEETEIIEKIYIGEQIRKFGMDNNGWFESLNEILVSEANDAYYTIDGVLFASNGDILIFYPPGKQETEYTIPEGTRGIEYCAIANCRSLERIVFPNSMQQINTTAVYCCYFLKEVYLGANTRFSEAPFFNCNELQKIEISAQNTALKVANGVLLDDDEHMLVYYMPNQGKSSFTIPSGIKVIASNAFIDAGDDLTYIEMQDGVQRIDEYAFFGLYGENVRISVPESVQEIDYGAFGDDNVTLLVEKGSYAETYAREDGIKYEYQQSANTAGMDPDTLAIGSRGDRVKEVQLLLIEMGLLQGKADGIYGNQTAAAVKKLQGYWNREQTGEVDPLLYYRMFKDKYM